MELEPQGIGVSILCPGWVATRITESRCNWPEDDGEPQPPQWPIAELVRNGMAQADVAALVRKAVQANELYIFTHPDMRPPLEMRVDRFLAAYRKLGAGPQEIKR